jgi:hypothetical protein
MWPDRLHWARPRHIFGPGVSDFSPTFSSFAENVITVPQADILVSATGTGNPNNHIF